MNPKKKLRLSSKYNINDQSINSVVNETPAKDGVKKGNEFYGLSNLQNTCYINCILHLMASTPLFLENIHNVYEILLQVKKKSELSSQESLIFNLHQVFCSLRKAKLNSCSQQFISDSCTLFLQSLRKLESMYDNNLQHDAHEFFCKVLNHLDDTICKIFKKFNNKKYFGNRKTKKRKSNVHLSVIKKFMGEDEGLRKNFYSIFHGLLSTTSHCRECEIDKRATQPFISVDVNLKDFEKDEIQDDGTDQLSENESMDKDPVNLALIPFDGLLYGDNKLWCSNCLHLTEADMTKCYDKLPSVLTFHIKRFASKTSQKNPKSFKVPRDFIYEHPSNSQKSSYNLYGFVIHSGTSVSFGHFTCYIKQKSDHSQSKIEDCCFNKGINEWLHYDDDKVRPVRDDAIDFLLSEQSNETINLLFYYRN